MLAESSTLSMFALREDSCSGDRVSDCATSGMTLVRCDRRRRYSMSTGLTPVSLLE